MAPQTYQAQINAGLGADGRLDSTVKAKNVGILICRTPGERTIAQYLGQAWRVLHGGRPVTRAQPACLGFRPSLTARHEENLKGAATIYDLRSLLRIMRDNGQLLQLANNASAKDMEEANSTAGENRLRETSYDLQQRQQQLREQQQQQQHQQHSRQMANGKDPAGVLPSQKAQQRCMQGPHPQGQRLLDSAEHVEALEGGAALPAAAQQAAPPRQQGGRPMQLQVQVSLPLNGQGLPCATAKACSVHIMHCGDLGEQGVALDLCNVWREQHCESPDGHWKRHRRLIMARYRSETGLLQRLQQAGSLSELRALLKQLGDSVQLRTLAARHSGTVATAPQEHEVEAARVATLKAQGQRPGAAADAADAAGAAAAVVLQEEEAAPAAAVAVAARGGTVNTDAAAGLGRGRQAGPKLTYNAKAGLPLEAKGRLNGSLRAKQVYLLSYASQREAQLAPDLAVLWRYRLCGHVQGNASSTARLHSSQAVLARLEEEDPGLLQQLWQVGNLEELKSFLRALRDGGQLRRLCERIGAPSGEDRGAGVDEPQPQQAQQQRQQQLEQPEGEKPNTPLFARAVPAQQQQKQQEKQKRKWGDMVPSSSTEDAEDGAFRPAPHPALKRSASIIGCQGGGSDGSGGGQQQRERGARSDCTASGSGPGSPHVEMVNQICAAALPGGRDPVQQQAQQHQAMQQPVQPPPHEPEQGPQQIRPGQSGPRSLASPAAQQPATAAEGAAPAGRQPIALLLPIGTPSPAAPNHAVCDSEHLPPAAPGLAIPGAPAATPAMAAAAAAAAERHGAQEPAVPAAPAAASPTQAAVAAAAAAGSTPATRQHLIQRLLACRQDRRARQAGLTPEFCGRFMVAHSGRFSAAQKQEAAEWLVPLLSSGEYEATKVYMEGMVRACGL